MSKEKKVILILSGLAAAMIVITLLVLFFPKEGVGEADSLEQKEVASAVGVEEQSLKKTLHDDSENDIIVGNISYEPSTVAESKFSKAEKWQEGAISYGGSFYKYNNNIKTYLFLGIDNDSKVAKAPDYVSGGQSDAMFLLVVDDKSEKVSIISINRNTMTDIEMLDMNGQKLGTFRAQICLAHGYGDGMRTSCQRSVEVVSDLFYNIPVTGYFSLNMGGIPTLNDSVGGVTLTVSEDFDDDSRNVHFKAGEKVTLEGIEAYSFLRARDINEFDSAGKRLERQQLYIDALVGKLHTMLGQSKSKVLEAYESLEDYTVTNIDFSRLLDTLADFDDQEPTIYSMPGVVKQGKVFEEFEVDEDSFYELILSVFYLPVK